MRHARRRTRSACALLSRWRERLVGARGSHVHCGVARRRVHQSGRVPTQCSGCCGVRHYVATLAGGEVAAAHQPFHVFVQVVQVVFIHKHYRVRWPARVEDQGGCHRRSFSLRSPPFPFGFSCALSCYIGQTIAHLLFAVRWLFQANTTRVNHMHCHSKRAPCFV